MAVEGRNSLHFANVMDNSGLAKGKLDAVNIVSSMAQQISKINPFAALAVGAIAAFTVIASEAKKLAKEFESAMKEVETISGAVQKDFHGISEAIIDLSKISPDSPVELAKAFYQIVSAGYDGAKGLELLEVASKAALAGVTETVTAADGITTILNAYKKDASEAEAVSDALFTTVKLGKTTFGELASSISQIAPIAAASNIPLNEILSLVASLTKQGVPTAQAMTQIRAGIIALNETSRLDGTKTLQENLQALYDEMGGNQTKITEEVGRVEALQAVLAVAGNNAKAANEDLKTYSSTLNATNDAAKIMLNDNENQWKIFNNRIKATTTGLGDAVLEISTKMAKGLNRLLETNSAILDQTAREKTAFQELKEELEDVNTSYDRKQTILNELKAKYPNYLQSLELDKITNENINEVLKLVKGSLQDINKLYERRIELAAYFDAENEAKRNKDNAEADYNNAEKKFRDVARQIRIFAQDPKNDVKLTFKLTDEPEKIFEDIERAFSDSNGEGFFYRLNFMTDMVTAMADLNHELPALKQANIELAEQTEYARQASIEVGNTAEGYKEVVEQINKMNDLRDLKYFQENFDYEPIVQAIKDRQKIILILDQISKVSEADYKEDEDALKKYLNSTYKVISEAAEKRLAILKGGKGAATSGKTDLEDFQKLLSSKASAYSDYENAIALIGKVAADKLYADLISQEDNFKDYLDRKYKAVKGSVEKEKAVLKAAQSAGVDAFERAPEMKVEVEVLPIVKDVDIDTTSINAINAKLDRLNKKRLAARDQEGRDTIQKEIDEWELKLDIATKGEKAIADARQQQLRLISEMDGLELKRFIEKWEAKLEAAQLIGNEIAMAEAQANIDAGQNRKWDITVGLIKDNLAKVASEFNSFAGTVTGDLIDGLAGAAAQLDNLFTALDKNSDQSQVISAGVSGAIGLIGLVTSASAERKRAEEEYYLSVIAFQKEYNRLLNDQIRDRESATANVFTDDFISELQAGLEALSAANVSYSESLAMLSEGRAKVGQRNGINWGAVGSGAGAGAATGAAVGSLVPVIGTVIGAAVGAVVGGIVGLFGGKKKKDEFTNLMQEYPELIERSADGQERLNVELAETLISQNLVNKKTKLLLEDAIKWTDQIEKAKEQIKGVIEQLAGGLGDSLRDTLVTAFETGADAAVSMGETVSEVLESILEQLIFNEIFSQAFKQLEEEMADSFDIGGDGTWIDDFKRFFDSAQGLSDDFDAAMQAAQDAGALNGFTLWDGDAAQKNGLAGAISTITEDTANVLSAALTGVRIDVANGLIVARESNIYLYQINVNTTTMVEQLETNNLRLKNIENALS